MIVFANTDVRQWFAHQRPKYLAWYGFSLAVTGKLAPTLAGFINYGQVHAPKALEMSRRMLIVSIVCVGLAVDFGMSPCVNPFEPGADDLDKYWTAIWIAIAFVYCLFLMEETNYDRRTLNPLDSGAPVGGSTTASSEVSVPFKTGHADEKTTPVSTVDVESGQIKYHRKTYLQKLGVIDKKRPNRMLDIFVAPFKGFTYPAVVYAGLMYGANNLVWYAIQ